MIKLVMIYFGSLCERTGAGKVAKTFFDEKALFRNYGIDEIDVYSLNKNSQNNNDKASYKLHVKKIIKDVMKKTYLGSCLSIKATYFKNGRLAVKQYIDKGCKIEDALIFHDIYSCYSYLKYCKNTSSIPKKYLLVEHTNGELWKMLHTYFPRITGSRFEHYLNEVSDLCESQASNIIFVSSASANYFKKLRPQFANKVVVIPNGIKKMDSLPRKRDYSKLNLITVGTVNERKNQIALIECIKRLSDSNICLQIVGSGNSLEECNYLIMKYHLESQISTLGARDDIPDLLDNANAYIMSSFDEGLPISAIEALRSGMPLILTNVGGCSELIDNNGYLVKPTVDELCDAIMKLRKDPVEAQSMGENSYSIFLSRYCLDIMVERYSSLLKFIIGAK